LTTNKNLIIPLAALITITIILTATTAAFLNTQPTTPNDTTQTNTDTIKTDDNQNIQTPNPTTPPETTPTNTNPDTPNTSQSPTSTSAPTSSPNSGNTVSTNNVDIYADASATTKYTSIDWGTLSPGENVTRTIYIKNSANTAETLNMTTSGWNPAFANSILTITWDKEGSTLPVGAIVPAILTLQVAQETGAITNFNVNIVITGSS
jgi:hypothetical protein